MAKAGISPNRVTDRTIRSIDRKREKERKRMFHRAKDHARDFSILLIQRLVDRKILETDNLESIQEKCCEELNQLPYMDDFDLQMKISPLRTLVQDPNVVSLYFTQFIVEDLVEHPDVQDVFGDDLDVYRAVDSIFRVLRQE